jgi:hypothetical protein
MANGAGVGHLKDNASRRRKNRRCPSIRRCRTHGNRREGTVCRLSKYASMRGPTCVGARLRRERRAREQESVGRPGPAVVSRENVFITKSNGGVMTVRSARKDARGVGPGDRARCTDSIREKFKSGLAAIPSTGEDQFRCPGSSRNGRGRYRRLQMDSGDNPYQRPSKSPRSRARPRS